MSQTAPTTPDKGEPRRAFIRALDALRTIKRSPSTTLLSSLDELGRAHGTRLALLGTDEQLSYGQLIDRTRCIAGGARASTCIGARPVQDDLGCSCRTVPNTSHFGSG